MPLSRRVGLLLACGYALMASCLIGTLSHFQFADSLQIEQQLARKDLSQLLVSLDKLKARLVAHHEEWGHWDDAYEFVQGDNPAFKADYLDLIDGLTLVTHYIYLDDRQQVAASGVRDYDAGAVSSLPSNFQEQLLDAYHTLSQRGAGEAQQTGLLLIDGTLHFLCVGAVTRNSDAAAPPVGGLIFTLRIAPETLAEISRDMELPLEVVTRSDSQFKGLLQTYLEHKAPDASVALTFSPDENVHAAGLLTDVDGQPAAFVNTYAPEHIYARSKRSFELVFFMICLFAFGSMLLTHAVIWKYLVAPLEIVSRRLNEVSENRDSTTLLHNPGGYELGVIVNGINKAFAALGELEGEFRTSRDHAIAANEAKSSFVAKVSHELRTPIHGILGLLRIIRKKVVDQAARTQLSMVRDSTVGLLGVVNDILDFSKAEVGDLPVTPAAMKLRETVRSALRVVAPRIFERVESDLIECVASIDPSLPDDVFGDGKRIAQILINLLSNAIKFTRNGSVCLTVRRGETSADLPTIEFAVSDTGIGIPADKLGLIFEPFKQVDDSVSRRYSGTGLGLAIVSQLIAAMNGEINVTSEMGRGSTFTVRLPLQELNGSHPSVEPPSTKNAWVINNASKESELIGRAMQRYRIDVRCDSTDTLTSRHAPRPSSFPTDLLIVAGNTLVNPETWRILQDLVAQRGPGSVVATLSPHELSFRERLGSLGVTNILLTPLVTEDVLETISGRYRENFAGYDDYLDEIPQPKSGLTMLVADDILTNQIVLRSTLQRLGHDVTVVSNGKEVLDAVGHQVGLREKQANDKEYDLLLIDVQMPVMDGLEAIRQIRNSEARQARNLRIPILSVTAHAFSQEHSKMFDAGADGVLAKPIEDRELVRLIETHARRAEVVTAEAEKVRSEPAHGSDQADPEASIERLLRALDELDGRTAEAAGLTRPPGGFVFIDANRLKQRAGRDLSLLNELISSFRITAEEVYSQLQADLERQDLAALEQTAHTLKGSLGEMGCYQGAVLASDIVDRCRSGRGEEALTMAANLDEVVQSTLLVLRGICPLTRPD